MRFSPGFLKPAAAAGGGGTVDRAYQGDIVLPAVVGTTQTFVGALFGAAATGRKIYVPISWNDNYNISAMTIGGVAATKRVSAVNTVASPFIASEIWEATVETGTSGNIVVTLSAAAAADAPLTISTYRVVPVTAPASDTDTATGDAAATALTTTIDVLAGGAVIACHARYYNDQSVIYTGLTEDADISPLSYYRHTVASEEFATTQTALAVVGTGNAAGECAQCAVAIG